MTEFQIIMADNDSATSEGAAAHCMMIHSIFNEGNFVGNQTNSTALSGNASFPSSSLVTSNWLRLVINTVFCGFGVLGNLITIVILSRHRMKAAMSCRIERASTAGLVALAVADLLCCTSSLAVTYGRGMGYRRALYSEHERVRILSVLYGPFVQNACVKSNVWLTVVVAVGRYMVICRPLHARYLVSVTATRLAIVAALIAAVLIELPTLWTSSVLPLVCPTTDEEATEHRYFVVDSGRLVVDSRLKMTYDVVSISLGFIVPVGLLVFCNCRLICSLRQSHYSPRQCNHEEIHFNRMLTISCSKDSKTVYIRKSSPISNTTYTIVQ